VRVPPGGGKGGETRDLVGVDGCGAVRSGDGVLVSSARGAGEGRGAQEA
jgi:hypothetical protein